MNVSNVDTITLLDSENKRIGIRINGIDAPEKAGRALRGSPRAKRLASVIELGKARRRS